ncbi:MAG TPA: hypothetical protein VEI81_07540 [Methanoregula sp.]|nr:hypothetical protein [Methanoregula sp.]
MNRFFGVPGALLLMVLLSVILLTAGCTDIANSINPFADQTTPVPTTEQPVVTETIPAIPAETPPLVSANATEEPAVTAETTASVAGTQTTAPSASRTYLTYTNASYGFSINYPSDWQVEEGPVETGQDPGVPSGYSYVTDVVEFYSPAIARCNHGSCVDVRAELHVEVDNAPPTTDIDQYYIHDVAAISQNYPIDITGHAAVFKLSGQNAYILSYKLDQDPIDIKVTRAYTIADGKAFILTYHTHVPYSGEVDQGVIYSNVIDTMLRSFQIASPNKTL